MPLKQKAPNILNMPWSNTPEMAASLDAEKAFDRVEYRYHFTAIKRFGLSEDFISWVKLLYPFPVASVQTNMQSPSFSLGLGFPLLPLLSAIATAIQFEGIKRLDTTHK